MAARGEDNLTQIQKYKAMLKSKRNKGDEKATRRPKKTRLSKGHDETAPEDNALPAPGSTQEPSSKSLREDFKQEQFDVPKLDTNTDLLTEPKQSPVLSSTNDDDLVDPKAVTTGAEDTKDKESELVNDGEPTETACKTKDEQKKEKSKGLSLRRKKKSKKRKEPEEKVAPPVKNEGKLEEDLEENYSWKKSAPELLSALPLSKDTTQDDNLCVEESPGQNPEADEYETIEEPDGKEKISRAKKFKRWAKFGKGKKTSAAVDLENSEPNNSSIQDPESLDDGPSLPGEKVEEVENPAKEEPVDEQEDLEPPPLPQKQRRRSSSLNEPTDQGNESLSLGNAQRIRSASLGKENLSTSLPPEQPNRILQVKNISVEQDSEEASKQKEDETAKLDEQNNDQDVNDVNNEQALAKQKTNSSIDEDEHKAQQTSDKKETGESSAKGDQPKKKKKSLLRKISSKNPKASKKDYQTRETSKKPKISAPLLVKYESLTGSDVLTNAKPIEEASPEKPANKRKKSGLTLKLPKALKRPKASDYQVIGGAEAEKESKQDEMFSQNNAENSEAVDEEESREEEKRADIDGEEAESEEVAGSGTGESEGNNSDDAEAYSIRLALMKDVLKELVLHMKTKQCPSEENERVQETNDTPIAEELTNNEEDNKANDVQKEEELIHVAESSRDPSQEIIVEERSQDIEDEEQPEQPNENSDEQEKDEENEQLEKPDISVQKEEENGENPESKEQRESQDIEKSSDETEEVVQKSLDLEPEEPESEPNTTENEQESEHVIKSCEDEIKQPEEMPKETEEPINPEDNPQPEDVPTKSEDTPNKDNPELEDVPEQPEDEPKESEDNEVSELSDSQPTETSFERSADKVLSSEGMSNFFSNGVSTLERSIEASMMTRALIDTYILIDHSLQLSEDFLKCVEMMDLNSASARSSRCNIM